MLEINVWILFMILYLAGVGTYYTIRGVHRYIQNVIRNKRMHSMIASVDAEDRLNRICRYSHAEDINGDISSRTTL
jgi:hypothetical protein